MVINALCPAMHVNKSVNSSQLATQQLLSLSKAQALHPTNVIDRNNTITT